jgi:uncharacterized protein YaiE (UPF0345 family)
MSQFTNVAITKEANIYFDGNVTSRSVHFANGTKKTLGIMLPGEYEFNTGAKELMEIMSGDLEIQLVGEEWRKISAGESFEVPANSSFKLKIYKITDYCCSFLG